MTSSDTLQTPRPARILVAEDEELIQAVFHGILTKAGFQVICTGDGTEAAAIFDKEPNAFDLLITDLSLPGISGEALAAHIRKARPDLKLIFSTGNITQAPQQAVNHFKGAMFLPKPFGFEDLVAIVNKALALPAA
jgi:DNA-binding NtrC family response regulator